MAPHRARAFLERCLALALCASAPVLAATASALAAQDALVVLLDRAKVVKLPAQAQTLIVGNPIVADVTLVKDTMVMVITGKGFGETNLVILDKDGKLLTEEIIRVKAGDRKLMVVQRGFDRESYACSPRCEPTVQLGDAVRFTAETGAQITGRNGLATSGSRP